MSPEDLSCECAEQYHDGIDDERDRVMREVRAVIEHASPAAREVLAFYMSMILMSPVLKDEATP